VTCACATKNFLENFFESIFDSRAIVECCIDFVAAIDACFIFPQHRAAN